MEIKNENLSCEAVLSQCHGFPPCPPDLKVVVCASGLDMEIEAKSKKREPLFRYATLIPWGQGDKSETH